MIKYSEKEQELFKLLRAKPRTTSQIVEAYYKGKKARPYFADATTCNALHSLRDKRLYNEDRPFIGHEPRRGRTPAMWWKVVRG